MTQPQPQPQYTPIIASPIDVVAHIEAIRSNPRLDTKSARQAVEDFLLASLRAAVAERDADAAQYLEANKIASLSWRWSGSTWDRGRITPRLTFNYAGRRQRFPVRNDGTLNLAVIVPRLIAAVAEHGVTQKEAQRTRANREANMGHAADINASPAAETFRRLAEPDLKAFWGSRDVAEPSERQPGRVRLQVVLKAFDLRPATAAAILDLLADELTADEVVDAVRADVEDDRI